MAHCWGYSLLPQAAETTRYKMLPKKYYEFILPQHSCLSLLLSLLLMLMMIITIKDLFRYLACHAIRQQRDQTRNQSTAESIPIVSSGERIQ